MADPVVVPCPANAWTKVATNITAHTVRLISDAPAGYSWTYRDTGTAAPADLSDAVPVRDGESLTFAAPADLYVYAYNSTGSVRLDS